MNIMANMSVFIAIFAIFTLAQVPTGGIRVGGRRDIDLNENKHAKSALDYAINHHNNRTNMTYLSEVSEVFSAQVQVVAGSMYYFTVNMARTNCTKDSVNEVCTTHQEPESSRVYECTFTVWSRRWLNSTIVTEKCKEEILA